MTEKRFPRFVQSWNRQDGAYIFDRQIPTKYNSIWVCMDIMNDLAEENEELKEENKNLRKCINTIYIISSKESVE